MLVIGKKRVYKNKEDKASEKMAIKILFSVVILLALSSRVISGENEVEWEVKFDRDYIKMVIGESDNFMLLVKFLKTGPSNATIRVFSSDPDAVKVYKTIHLSDNGNAWKGFQVEMQALDLGNANISVEITRNDRAQVLDHHVAVSVIRNHLIKKFRPQNVLFYLKFMQYFYILMNMCFGAALDVKKLKIILRNPVGPSLALISNFVILPLVS